LAFAVATDVWFLILLDEGNFDLKEEELSNMSKLWSAV